MTYKTFILKHLFLTVLEAEEVQDHVIADLVSGEGLIPCS